QIIASFQGQRDPYGKPWPPRKKAADWAIRAFGLMQDDGHPLLDNTGRMVESITVKALATSIRVTALGYAAFHQEGTHSLPPRRWFPDPVLGLGPIWGDGFLRVSGRVARAFMGAP